MSRILWLVAALCGLVMALTPVAGPAALASPKPSPKPSLTPSPGAEGGTEELSKQLDDANRAYIDAQNLLSASQERQTLLAARQGELEPRYAQLRDETQTITIAAYQNGGGMRSAATLLASGSPSVFADKVSTLEVIARRNFSRLRELTVVRDQMAATRAAIDTEVGRQQQQLAEMARQKAEVEKALTAAQDAEVTRQFDAATTVSGKTPVTVAEPAPRSPDGSWPAESCDMQDPTTEGCLTPRTLHALLQVRKAGFGHFVSCWRTPPQPYEHPKGRACDFAADPTGFGGIATGAALEYGTELAAWLVRNATSLGLMYVIWFRQIWTPAAGWHAYSSGKGDPSSDHTNHVHMSIY